LPELQDVVRIDGMNVAIPVRPRHSPCIGVCKLDEQSGFCLGCARTGDEIAAWASLDEFGRNAIWQKLPERLTALATRSSTGSREPSWSVEAHG
jgi:predicted Fe-S protein YdhL (DUF1289 family)